jgi:hypothetical protein
MDAKDAVVALSLGAAWVGAVTGLWSLHNQRREKRERISMAPREFTVTAQRSVHGEPGVMTVVIRNKGGRPLVFASDDIRICCRREPFWPESATSLPVNTTGGAPSIPIGGRWDFYVTEVAVAFAVDRVRIDEPSTADGYLLGELLVQVEATDDDTTERSEWIQIDRPSSYATEAVLNRRPD